MKIPHLRKKLEIKSCHSKTWEDNYSWIHQKDILDVLKDKNKWRASMNINGKKTNLGTFSNLNDAIAARKAAEKGVSNDV